MRINVAGAYQLTVSLFNEAKENFKIHVINQKEIRKLEAERLYTETYLRDLQRLSDFYANDLLRSFVEDFFNYDRHLQTFEKSIALAEARGASTGKYLRTKHDTDQFFITGQTTSNTSVQMKVGVNTESEDIPKELQDVIGSLRKQTEVFLHEIEEMNNQICCIRKVPDEININLRSLENQRDSASKVTYEMINDARRILMERLFQFDDLQDNITQTMSSIDFDGSPASMIGAIIGAALGAAVTTIAIKSITMKRRDRCLKEVEDRLRNWEKKSFPLVEIQERIKEIEYESTILCKKTAFIKSFGLDYSGMTEEQQYILGAYVNSMSAAIRLLEKPIEGFMLFYNNAAVSEVLPQYTRTEFTSKQIGVITFFCNLLIGIDTTKKERKLLGDVLADNDSFLHYFEIKKEKRIPGRK